MKIINIVDNATSVNSGIWQAAISTSKYLKEKYNVDSELWYPKPKGNFDIHFITQVPLTSLKLSIIDELILERNLSPSNTLIVTHGCWQYPTLWGRRFKTLGYKWIYVPQGMLEPWSLSQKKWLKFFYFNIIEKPKAVKANIIRAVASPERDNLLKIFKSVELIPNGVEIPDLKDISHKAHRPILFLFMARLHHKKGIKQLINGWLLSKANNHPNYKLVVAGPDHGELNSILPLINKSKNTEYVGMVRGKQKHQLLAECHFYILPSFSEGFPTSVVEAMSYGLIPLITQGCNFPEALEQQHALNISTEPCAIAEKINLILENQQSEPKNKSEKIYHFISENYSISRIAEMQFLLFKKLLSTL